MLLWVLLLIEIINVSMSTYMPARYLIVNKNHYKNITKDFRIMSPGNRSEVSERSS